jgi:mannosyltransferase
MTEIQRKDAKMRRSKESNQKNPFASLPLSAFALIFFILLLAFYLRFHLLGAQSLWNDEGNSYVQATRSFVDIAANAARDIHPPGYYWLLAIWRFFTGDTEFALRSLSAYASVLSVAFTYALGKRLYGPMVGVSAALFVTLNTFSIYYAQEARMYSLLALWGVASMWALVGFLTSPPSPLHTWRGEQIKWVLALALLNAAGLWTQYAYPFVMLAQGVMVVLWGVGKWFGRGVQLSVPRIMIYYTLTNLLTIALYLPWLPTAWAQISMWPNTGDASVPIGEALLFVVNWLMVGITTNIQITVFLAAFLLVTLIPVSSYKRERVWWRALFPVVWTMLSIGLFLALGLFREDNVKFLLPAQIAFALWMARSVDVLWTITDRLRVPFPQVLRTAIALGTLAFVFALWNELPLLYYDPAYQRDDYRGIVRDISADARDGDAIILDAPNQEEVFRYYYRGDAAIFPLPAGLGGNDSETYQFVYNEIIPHFDSVYAVFWGDTERDPNHVVENVLDTRTFSIGTNQWYGDVRLARYATPVDGLFTLNSQDVHFGEQIILEAYSLSTATVQPGDFVQVALSWQTNAPLSTRYKVFVQLLNEYGGLVAQHDSEPVGDSAPTNMWEPNRTYTDLHGIVIPDELLAGDYRLIAGLYNSDFPQERLPVGEGNSLTLATITVTE